MDWHFAGTARDIFISGFMDIKTCEASLSITVEVGVDATKDSETVVVDIFQF